MHQACDERCRIYWYVRRFGFVMRGAIVLQRSALPYIAGKVRLLPVANAEQVVFGKISLRAEHWYDCRYVQFLSLAAPSPLCSIFKFWRRSHLCIIRSLNRFTVVILAESVSAAGQRSETNRTSYWQIGGLPHSAYPI